MTLRFSSPFHQLVAENVSCEYVVNYSKRNGCEFISVGNGSTYEATVAVCRLECSIATLFLEKIFDSSGDCSNSFNFDLSDQNDYVRFIKALGEI